MSKKVLWITETAVLIALLVVLQAATAPIPKPFGQYVTGSCVNAVLGVAALYVGLSSGLVVALVSPFFAFLLGIGPQLIAIVPAIAAGNAVLVVVLWLLARKQVLWQNALGVAAAACAKFLTLYLLVVMLICNVMALPEPQVKTFSAMFSWPQLVTALIGGAAALVIAETLRKALKR